MKNLNTYAKIKNQALLNITKISNLTTPQFGCYSASCKSSEINKNKPSHITLERRGYNPITSNYLTIEIDCAFDAGTTRHAGVPNAIESKATLSVCGELYK
ncbi:43702_t:CDS:1, partial [Gigaspora margarita]